MSDPLYTDSNVRPTFCSEYMRLLFPVCCGHALWAPRLVDIGGGALGDVGMIVDGAFYRTFNAYEHHDVDNTSPLPLPTMLHRDQPYPKTIMSSSSDSNIEFHITGSAVLVAPPFPTLNVQPRVTLARATDGLAFLAPPVPTRWDSIHPSLRPQLGMWLATQCQARPELEGHVIVTEVVRSSGYVGGLILSRNTEVSANLSLSGVVTANAGASVGHHRSLNALLRGPETWTPNMPAEYPIILKYTTAVTRPGFLRRVGLKLGLSRSSSSPQAPDISTSTASRAIGPGTQGSARVVAPTEPAGEETQRDADQESAALTAICDPSPLTPFLDMLLQKHTEVDVAFGDLSIMGEFLARHSVELLPDPSLVNFVMSVKELESTVIAHLEAIDLLHLQALSSPGELDARIAISTKRRVRISVISAAELPRDVFQAPKPLAVVTVDGKCVLTTNRIKNSYNPHWNETCDVEVTWDSIVTIEVRDKHKLNSKHPERASMGTVSVRICDYLDFSLGTEQHKALERQLCPLHEEQMVCGKLTLHLRAFAVEASPTPQHTPSSTHGTLQRTPASSLHSSGPSGVSSGSPIVHVRARSGSATPGSSYRSPTQRPALGIGLDNVPDYELDPQLTASPTSLSPTSPSPTSPTASNRGHAPPGSNSLQVADGRGSSGGGGRSGSGNSLSFDQTFFGDSDYATSGNLTSYNTLPNQSTPVIFLHITPPQVLDLAEPSPRDTHRPHPLETPPALLQHPPRTAPIAAPPLSTTRAQLRDASASAIHADQQSIPAGVRLSVSLFGTAGREAEVEVLSAEVHDFGASAVILRGQVVHPAQAISVALKVIRAALSSEDRMLLRRELDACSQVKHPHILAFMGTASWEYHTILVAPYMQNGNLTKYLKAHPLADRAALILQVANAVQFLHDNARPGRVHGDLKCENVLVSDSGHALLADFGLATTTTVTQFGQHFTLRFAAPELLTDMESTEGGTLSKTAASDVYAFGMLMLQAYSGEVPWSGMSLMKVIMEVARGQAPPRPNAGFTDELWNLCLKCWSRNPELRPDMGRVVRTLESIVDYAT